MYLQTLPPLDVECLDLDGDNTTLPIILSSSFFSYHGHSDLSTLVRSSMYLQTLPPLDVECLDLDRDNTTLLLYYPHLFSVTMVTVIYQL